MIDPSGDARDLSKNAIEKMTKSAFGDIAGPVVSDELLDLLGLGSTSKIEEYLEKIQSQLATMQAQIVQLQASVNQILSGIAVIEEQIPGIEVQQMLASFTQHQTTVKQNFQSYVDAVNGLTSSKPDVVKQATGDLFQLMEIINMQQVSAAMTAIQQLFVPALAEERGLIDLQHDVIRAAIVTFAANPENYRIATDPPRTLNDGRLYADTRAIPSGNGVFHCDAIVGYGHGKSDELLRTSVGGAFKAFITVQTQGLILLNMAWLGSIHEDQIKQQVAAIQVVLDAMKAFEPAIVKTIDDQVATSLKTSGQRLTGVAASNDIRYDYGYGDVRMQYPLGDDWLMWNQVDNDQYGPGLGPGIGMALAPWTYEQTIFAELTYNSTQDEPHIWIVRSDDTRRQQVNSGSRPDASSPLRRNPSRIHLYSGSVNRELASSDGFRRAQPISRTIQRSNGHARDAVMVVSPVIAIIEALGGERTFESSLAASNLPSWSHSPARPWDRPIQNRLRL